MLRAFTAMTDALLAPAVAYALPFSTGVTLYVAATDLMPEVNEERGWRMAMLVFMIGSVACAFSGSLAQFVGERNVPRGESQVKTATGASVVAP